MASFATHLYLRRPRRADLGQLIQQTRPIGVAIVATHVDARQPRRRHQIVPRRCLFHPVEVAYPSLQAATQAQAAIVEFVEHLQEGAGQAIDHAAAAEGLTDGRIQHPREIFMLEIEEIKQMATGEWHSRQHIAPLVARRTRDYEGERTQPAPEGGELLGVAGRAVQGPLHVLSETHVNASAAAILLTGESGLRWLRPLLASGGVISPDADLLSGIAAAARMGDLPAVTGVCDCATWPESTPVRLDPAQNLVKKGV